MQVTWTLPTFATLEPHTRALGDVVGGVALEAVGGARAEAAVVGAALAAPLLGVVEGLGTGGHTLTLIQVTLHPKLVCGGGRGVNSRRKHPETMRILIQKVSKLQTQAKTEAN